MVKFGPSISWVSLTGFMGLASWSLCTQGGWRTVLVRCVDRSRTANGILQSRKSQAQREKRQTSFRRGYENSGASREVYPPPQWRPGAKRPRRRRGRHLQPRLVLHGRPGFIQRSGYHEDDDEHQHEHQHTVSVRSVNYPHVRHKNGVLRIDALGNKAPSFTSDATFVAVAGRHGRN